MRSKFLSLMRTSVLVQNRTMASRADRCDAHMNELPVPCGPWGPYFAERNAFYNKILVLGILTFLGSIGMVIYTDSMFLNWGPPAVPGPPSDMIEECEDEP